MATPTNTNLTNLKSLMQIPVVKQLIMLLGIAGSVTLGIVLFMSIQEPLYQPLDYQINSQNMAAIVDTLQKAGVQYKINNDEGIIYVAAKDIQNAKIKLSAAGIAKDDGFNFSYLNEQTGIGNSQFLENARYIRALESDLSRTISAIEGVSSARVHIAIPQNTVFADENGKPTASVVLSMAPGLMSDKEKIRAIVQVVASSVPGLDPKDVAITDQYGHYLSGLMNEDALFSAEQLNYQNSIQNYYEKRVESMIMPILGENKVSVRVHADIDFTRQEEAKEEYNPDQKVVRSEQSITQTSGSSAASGPPGSLSNSPPSQDSGSDNKSSSSAGTQSKSESTKNYELGKSVSYKKSNYPKVNSLSVAVVVDNQMVEDPKTRKMVSKPVDAETIKKITELVKASIGFDEKRGDNVTVVNSSFNIPKMKIEEQSIQIWNQPWFWDLIKKLIGIGVGLYILMTLLKHLKRYMNVTMQEAPQPVKLIDEGDGTHVTPEMMQLKQEQINRLRELANMEPNRVAIIIKNWIGKQ